ncbi:protein PML-like [Heteronotia binoei]|uniref:protein PML-like n=1 Tax=Heteronotia binoei TaxID=13085 RepID=UPI00292E59D5|nr:protein PML-like [Heteronotia binoei]
MAQDNAGSSPAPPERPEMEKEFQFLSCENCRQEAGCPKLLPCLHNICTECLHETKPANCCPICETPHSQTEGTAVQDNMLFANLRDKLRVFQMIKSGQDLVCNNCKKEGTYWCSDCQEFLCTPCFESHQRYLKRESHEARAVKDIKANSSEGFLAEFKNVTVMFCSIADHRMQHLSIYCKACQRSMCCVCAVLDSRHNGRHCHIQEEIQRRQQELLSMSTELKEKKTSYDQTCVNLREMIRNMVETKNKTREQIEQKVAEMVRLVQEEGEKLLASVQEQHQRHVQNVDEKLHRVELVVQRMESSKELVEKMRLYASDQEVLDMYPFIRESLEELKRKQPPVVETQIPVGNFAEVETRLQAFYERVTKEKEAAPIPVRITSSQESLGKEPVKRKIVQVGNFSQTPAKFIKTEPDNSEQKQSAGQVDREQPGTSLGDHPAGNGSSIWKGEDTEIISEKWFPVSFSESSDTDAFSCLNSGGDDSSGDDVVSVGSILQEDISSESRQDDYWRNIFRPPRQLVSGQGSLVFFDLKVLPGKILHLVAVIDETSIFSVVIQPLLSSPRRDMQGGLCEIGLEAFLCCLLSLHQPILVGYDLWSMNFPALAGALRTIKKEEDFKGAIFGFLDALPLIKERVPNLPSYSLKSLENIYLTGQLNESQVIDCAKTVKDLCIVLDLNPGVDRRLVIPYSSLQSFGSLKPLLTRGLLSRSTVQALALHGVSLYVLLSVYKKDPGHGLQKFARYLNSRQISGGRKIRQLIRARLYFDTLPSMSQASTSAATKSETCFCH